MGVHTYILFFLFLHGVYGNNQLRADKVDYRSAFDQDLYEDVLNQELCNLQLSLLANGTDYLEFLDASGRFPSGFMQGNWHDFGDYYQCLGINKVIQDVDIQGKYCAIQVPLQQDPIEIPEFPSIPGGDGWPEDWLPIFPTAAPPTEAPGDPPAGPPAEEQAKIYANYMRLQAYARGISGVGEPVESRVFPILITANLRSMIGVCIPKACTPTHAIEFFQSRIPFVNFTYNEYYCRLPNDKPFATADIVAIVIFGFIGLLTITSTCYDLYQTFVLKRDARQVNQLYACFSVYTNTRRTLTFSSAPGTLECVDGIRAISMLWVVVGHTYSMTLIGFIHNTVEFMASLSYFSSTWVTSAPITVDTFFMLSGILAVYTVIGKISRRRFIRTIHLFYLNRLLRMFPLLAAMVLLQASFFNHASDGPYWINQALATENCRNYWWSALLHIQNYVNPLNTCLPQTWYLSVDVQLYIVCPLVLVFLFGREKLAWIVLTAFVLLSLVGSSLFSFLYNFSAALANPSRLAEFTDYLKYYYFNTLARAPPFFIGMVYGYLLYLCKDKKIRISKISVAILWCLSFAMFAFCIFSIYPVMQLDHTAQTFDNFLNSYMRSIWAIGLGWLIFACVHGYGGPINWFLSLQIWKLPARLSYAVYLIHMAVIFTGTGSWLKTYYYTESKNVSFLEFACNCYKQFVFLILMKFYIILSTDVQVRW
ncbi:O-acyltransferase like protein-like isoform X2 [Trichoplusia ni]|uniref:O-acyltransferase like protein-like isoform X2 n=1 Tax=Trichoplusia ni TaxID=7111 RepID=A0A7E5W1L6_TRINI|nr:O-acyltransferase like protein-like isoform X2 [Trichoplusia ni]